jgi:negative regulator of genetic competence, sporulation and motility
MTIQQLSAQAVKIQLTAEELHHLLRQNGLNGNSPHLPDLIAFLLVQAESASQIPFSQSAVQVELMQDSTGGLTVYFSAEPNALHRSGGKTVRLGARFPDYDALRACCRKLLDEQSVILSSSLYRYRGEHVLVLRLVRTGAALPHHLLLEYGHPFRLSQMNRARLNENGICICPGDAVQTVCRSSSAE